MWNDHIVIPCSLHHDAVPHHRLKVTMVWVLKSWAKRNMSSFYLFISGFLAVKICLASCANHLWCVFTICLGNDCIRPGPPFWTSFCPLSSLLYSSHAGISISLSPIPVSFVCSLRLFLMALPFHSSFKHKITCRQATEVKEPLGSTPFLATV